MKQSSRAGETGPAIVARPTLFDHAMLPVPSVMPSVPQLCDFVGRHGGGGRSAAVSSDGERLTVSAWHKYAKENFKMDTGYVQLVFDIFFDATSDGNMTDDSDIPTAEFAVYLFLLSVFKDEALGGTPRARRADIAFPHLQQESLSPRSGQQLSPRTGHAGSKAGEQERRLTAIVHRHMKELLNIVGGSSTAVRISPAQVDALGIVLMAPFFSDGHGRRLSQLLPWWRSGGYEAVAVADVVAWLQEALPPLQEPPHRSGAAAGKSSGHADSPQLDATAAERSGGIVLNQVYKTTVIRSAQDLCPQTASQEAALAVTEQQWMRIQQCSDSFIYITAPLSRVVISGCANCTILIAAASLVTIEACQSLKVTVGCRRLHVSNSVDSTLYILTNRHPILLGENHDLVLAPFNALMSECLGLWRRLRVDRSRNRWAEPLWISRSGNNVVLSGGGETGVPGQSVMPPHNFFCITVPSHKALPASIVASQANPCPLPPAYASALQHKHKQVLDLRKEIAETEAVSAGGNKQALHRAIQARFKEWLVSSGNMRQVQDLIHTEHPHIEGVSRTGALSLHLP